MHDPLDQPRDQPGSQTGSHGRAAVAPSIQLDQSPAIEPVVDVDLAPDDPGVTPGDHPKKPALAVPTMWR
jgi:hypothetical protein